VAHPDGDRGKSEAGGSGGFVADGSTGRTLLLAFGAFLFLFGQSALVPAMALGSPDVATYAVVVAATALLAVPAARLFVHSGRSLSRLGDFVLTLALAQLVLVALGNLVLVWAGDRLAAATLQPAMVLLAYPVAHHFVYRGRAVSPLDLLSN
jgi:dipeptide/tripeptide permease